MKKRKKERTTEEKFKWLQMEILGVYSVLIIIVTAFLTIMILGQSSQTIREKVSSLVAANSHQLELNIDSYLNKVETTATLLFSDEAYYLFDETDARLEEYEKVKNEELITNRIVDLGLMENFSDFGIVYADDYTVGWISNVTKGMFSDGGIYEEFADCISNERTNDGWIFGMHDNVDRLYYVKRLNPNAILVASFYTRELANVFRYPEELSEMTVRLVNNDNRIMFSSSEDEIGETLSEEIATQIKGKKKATVIGEQHLVNVNVCQDNWRVVCSMPTSVIMEEINELRNFTIYFALALVGVCVIIGLITIRRISKPVDTMVTDLEIKATSDQLSGLTNKISFEEKIKEKLQEKVSEQFLVMVVLDMDNFKQINDRLGHAYGDQVIVRMGYLLSGVFYKDMLIGRIGGDEFALFRMIDSSDAEQMTKESVEKMICSQLDNLVEYFSDEFTKEMESCDISLSAGICVEQNDNESFESLYHKADAALYVSKRSGKSQYTIYQEGMNGEEV